MSGKITMIHKVINLLWNKEELQISGRNLLLYQFTKGEIKLANSYHGISVVSTSYILLNILPSRLLYCIVLYLFRIPSDPCTGTRTSHKPQDIESVITNQYIML
jgi:hypothetical protein